MPQAQYVMVQGEKWEFASATYLGATTQYTVACPADRQVQVGMGPLVLGEPRGEKIRFSGEKAITAIGAGSLHFRVVDGKGPCKVGFVETGSKRISGGWSF